MFIVSEAHPYESHMQLALFQALIATRHSPVQLSEALTTTMEGAAVMTISYLTLQKIHFGRWTLRDH